MNIIKLGFFDLIVKPVLKTINSEYMEKNIDEKIWLINKTNYMYNELLIAEENLSDHTKGIINTIFTENLNGNFKVYEIEWLSQIFINEGFARINRGYGTPITNKFLRLPGLIYYSSNASAHIIEEYYIRMKKENEISKQEIIEKDISFILKKMITIGCYLATYNKDEPLLEKYRNWETIIETEEFRRIKLRERYEKIKSIIMSQYDDNYKKIKEEIYKFLNERDNRFKFDKKTFINEQNLNNKRLISLVLAETLNILREQLNSVPKDLLWDAEMLVEDSVIGILTPSTNNKYQNSIKPKKNNNEKQSNNNKININNHKISEFFNSNNSN